MRARDVLVVGTALVAVVLVAGLPFVPDVSIWGLEADCARWIARADAGRADWFTQTFNRQHFAGYRPIMALSLTLDWWLGGGRLEPEVWRWTDLVAHVAVVVSIVPLGRALLPRSPWWVPWLAALLFAIHPVAEEVVPWLNRRSYSLSSLGANLALVAWLRAQSRVAAGRSPQTWLVLPPLMFGLLANELAFVVLVPMIVTARAAPRQIAWPLVTTVVLFAIRYRLIGDLGGYGFDNLGLNRAELVVREGISWVWFPAAYSDRLASPPLWVPAAAVIGAVGVFGGGLVLAAGERLRPGLRAAFAWFGAFFALLLVTQTWFYRMAYPIVVAQVLIVAGVAGAVAERERSMWVRGAAGVGIAAWLVLVLRGTPADGVDPKAFGFRLARDHQLRSLNLAIEQVKAPVLLLLVIPDEQLADTNPLFNVGSVYAARYAEVWARLLVGERRIDVRNFMVVSGGLGEPTVVPDGISIPVGRPYYLWPDSDDTEHRATAPVVVGEDDFKFDVSAKENIYLYNMEPLEGGLQLVRAGG